MYLCLVCPPVNDVDGTTGLCFFAIKHCYSKYHEFESLEKIRSHFFSVSFARITFFPSVNIKVDEPGGILAEARQISLTNFVLQ